MAEVTRQIVEFVTDTHYMVDMSIVPLLNACQQGTRQSQPGLIEVIQACLTQLELHAQRYHTGEAAAALSEAKGCLTAQSQSGGAAQQFHQAAAAWAATGRPYDQARALGWLAGALDAAGDAAAARLARDESFNLYTALAAQLDPQHQAVFLDSPAVRAVRPPASAAPRQPARRQFDALTERELEVLKLVAQGLTNAEIAKRLVLSPLTVNAHLRSIFNKLDVTSRTAAAR